MSILNYDFKRIVLQYIMNKILDVTEDIKQNLTDNENNLTIDSLMEIWNEKEKKKNLKKERPDNITNKKNLM